MVDYYKVLGVDKNASENDIKKAYVKMCLLFDFFMLLEHP